MKSYKWNYDEKGNIKFDYSEDELNRRFEYLSKTDNISKANYHDINDIKRKIDDESDSTNRKRYVAAWGAGCGKTTAIRQFIQRNYKEGIIYSAKTVEEIQIMCYNLVACGVSRSSISLIYSGMRILTIKYFTNHQ